MGDAHGVTVTFIMLASFATSLLACPRPWEEFGEWFDKEGIGWFVLSIPVWFMVASWCGMPFPVNGGD